MAKWQTRLLAWALGTKESDVARLIYLTANGQPAWTPRDYANLADEGYATNVTVFACINEIAKAVKGIRWFAGQERADGEMVELPKTHRLARLLKRPNPRQGLGSFLEWVVGHWMISGNSYINFVGPDSGPPMEMWTLRPDRVQVIPDLANGISAYRYEVNGQHKDIEAARVLHLRMFHPLSDWYGMAPIEPAARVIDTDNESVKWNKSMLQNSARPSGALVAPTTIGEDAYTQLKAQIASMYAGARNAGRPLLLEGGLDWKSMGLSPVDMDWLDGRKMTKREIAQAFGVPPELIGDSESKTYSNYQEARAAFYMETVLPLCDQMRDDFNTYLEPHFGEGVGLEYDRDDIEALQEEQSAKWARVTAADFLKVNEQREALGYEKTEGGDVILVNGSLVPLEIAGSTELPTIDDDSQARDDERDDEKPEKETAEGAR